MRLSCVIFLCGALLLVTGSGGALLEAVRFRRGAVAAACLALSVLCGAVWRVGNAEICPAVPAAALVFPFLVRGGRMRLMAALSAVPCGVLAWMLSAAFPTATECGPFAIVPVLLTCLLLGGAREGLCAAALLPVVYGLLSAAEGLYLFGYAPLSIGGGVQSDLLACGAAAVWLYAMAHKALARVRAHARAPARPGEEG